METATSASHSVVRPCVTGTTVAPQGRSSPPLAVRVTRSSPTDVASSAPSGTPRMPRPQAHRFQPQHSKARVHAAHHGAAHAW
jgi:hypothetical protein